MAAHSDLWPKELDALTASPEHHRLLLENDTVRVLETRIEPGETTAMHTHCWPAVYTILSWSDIVRRDEAGAITFDSRDSGMVKNMDLAVWSAPIGPHTLENVGDKPVFLVSVEIKG